MNEHPPQDNQLPPEPQRPLNEWPQQPYTQWQQPQQQPPTQYPPDYQPTYPPTYPPPPMPPAPPPRKKRGPLFWGELTVGLIVALIICGNILKAIVSGQASNTTPTHAQATQAPDLLAPPMAGHS